MNKLTVWVSAFILISSAYAQEEAKPTPEAKPMPHETNKRSLCDKLGETLSQLNDEKAKSIITGFCAQSGSGGEAFYVDKAQVTINVQGDDAIYKEKYHYKDNYGTKNTYKGYWE